MKLTHPYIISAAVAVVAISAVATHASAAPGDQGDRPAMMAAMPPMDGPMKDGMGPMNGMGGPMPMGGPMALLRMDSNKDGLISLDEFLAPRKARFAIEDTNKDGAISKAEFLAAKPADDMMAKRMERWEARATDAEKAVRQARKEAAFRALDGNGDGKISEAEFLSMAQLKFAALDANGDGSINVPPMKPRGMGPDRDKMGGPDHGRPNHDRMGAMRGDRCGGGDMPFKGDHGPKGPHHDDDDNTSDRG